MSIVGIGTDRVVIARIASSLARFGERFVARIYTANEYEQAVQKGNVARRLAMLFAAKEAVSKALGTGFRGGVAMCDIEVVHQPSGKPEVMLHGATKLVADALHIRQVHLSLTDDGGIAMAFAVSEAS